MSEAVAALYEAIEKAKPLIPRGINRVPGGDRGPFRPKRAFGGLKRAKGGWQTYVVNSRGKRTNVFIPDKKR